MRVLQWIPAFAGMTGNACWNGEQAKTIAGVAKETLVDAAENFSCHGANQNPVMVHKPKPWRTTKTPVIPANAGIHRES